MKNTAGRRKSECHRVRGLLSSYLDDRLSPVERDCVRYHAEVCEPCRRELESLIATVDLVRRLPAVTVPRSFRLIEATERHARLSFPDLFADWLQRAKLSAMPKVKHFRMATAAALVLLVGTLAVDLTGLVPAEGKSEIAQIAEVTTAPAPVVAISPSIEAATAPEISSPAPVTTEPTADVTHIPEAQQAPEPTSIPKEYKGIAGQVNETGEIAPTPAAPAVPGPEASTAGLSPEDGASPAVSPATVLGGEELLQKTSHRWIRSLEITLASLVLILGGMSLWIRQRKWGSRSCRRAS